MNIPFGSFFFLYSLFMSFSIASTIKILMFDLAVALDSATYIWPYENTGSGKYTLTLGIICSRALLMVVTKLSRLRNCFHLNLKGNYMNSSFRLVCVRSFMAPPVELRPHFVSQSTVHTWDKEHLQHKP